MEDQRIDEETEISVSVCVKRARHHQKGHYAMEQFWLVCDDGHCAEQHCGSTASVLQVLPGYICLR